jgi:hypothetical protein
MSDRLSRLAPLTGVIFAVLIVVAIISSGGETPDANASPAKVIAYYGTHRSEVETSAILFTFPRTRFRPDTRLDPGGQHVESHGGRYGWSAGGCPAR